MDGARQRSRMDAWRRVGTLDALARGLLALLLVALAFVALARFGADWSLSIITFAFVLVAYLAATAVTGAEPIYHALGRSTVRGWRRATGPARGRPAPRR